MKIRLTFTNISPITEIDIELPYCDELKEILEAECKRIEKEERSDLNPFDAARMLEGVLQDHLIDGMSLDFTEQTSEMSMRVPMGSIAWFS